MTSAVLDHTRRRSPWTQVILYFPDHGRINYGSVEELEVEHVCTLRLSREDWGNFSCFSVKYGKLIDTFYKIWFMTKNYKERVFIPITIEKGRWRTSHLYLCPSHYNRLRFGFVLRSRESTCESMLAHAAESVRALLHYNNFNLNITVTKFKCLKPYSYIQLIKLS